MRQQHVVAGPHQLAAVPRLRRQPFGICRPVPLQDEPVALFYVRHGQRAHGLLHGRVVSLAQANRHRELAPALHPGFLKVQLAHHRDIAPDRRSKLPRHGEVFHQVAPAIA